MNEEDMDHGQGTVVGVDLSSRHGATIASSESKSTGENEMGVDLSSSQEATIASSESKSTGENEVASLQPSPQIITISEDESMDHVMTGHAPVVRQSQGQSSDNTGKVKAVAVRITRSASKRQDKTVETLKEARADSTEERLVKAELRLQNYQTELKNIRTKLAASKKEFKDKKSQLWKKKKELAKCKREHQKSKGVIRDTKTTNNELQKSLQASEEQLSQCKDDLFSLQGVAQIPDSTITKRFESICQQIVHWIDTEVARFEKANPEAEPDHIYSGGQLAPSTNFLRQHSSAGEHLVRYHIHGLLGLHVFGKSVYFFGLPEETAQLLREAELKLAEFDPPRDSVAIASWRSETLKALGKTTTCGQCCEQQAQNLNNTLFKELSITFPVFFSGPQIRASFYNEVLLPAVKLANAMKASASDYIVWIPESPVTKFKPITIDCLKKSKVVDSENGKHLKPDSAVVADKDGIIGNIVLCLEPELCRVTKGKETLLYQGTVLVKLFHPLGPRVKPSA